VLRLPENKHPCGKYLRELHDIHHSLTQADPILASNFFIALFGIIEEY
jgi:sterol desaturase/sphingolipid hydroxylase (fatty acid hydroxylase superfamily)